MDTPTIDITLSSQADSLLHLLRSEELRKGEGTSIDILWIVSCGFSQVRISLEELIAYGHIKNENIRAGEDYGFLSLTPLGQAKGDERIARYKTLAER